MRDFASLQALSRPLRNPTPETRRLWTGVSVQSTEEGARQRAAEYPTMGPLCQHEVRH
jgi:hypothetical protein